MVIAGKGRGKGGQGSFLYPLADFCCPFFWFCREDALLDLRYASPGRGGYHIINILWYPMGGMAARRRV